MLQHSKLVYLSGLWVMTMTLFDVVSYVTWVAVTTVNYGIIPCCDSILTILTYWERVAFRHCSSDIFISIPEGNYVHTISLLIPVKL